MTKTKVLVQYVSSKELQDLVRQGLPDSMSVAFASRPENLKDEIPGVDILYGHIDPESLARADRLHWVQAHGTGVEDMLYPEFVKRKITLTNIKGVLATPISEHVFALLLALARNFGEFYELKKKKQWKIVRGWEIAGLTMGIIGLGHIGREVAKRANAFDMKVKAMDPGVSKAPPGVESVCGRSGLRQMLGECDVVVACCPATKENYHMLSREEFASMRAHAYFINVGRGAIVDEAALSDVLKSGKLAGAGLDVTETEPYPVNGPLWDAPNIIMTAHSCAYTQHLDRRKLDFLLENLKRFARKEPLLNVVDVEKGF